MAKAQITTGSLIARIFMPGSGLGMSQPLIHLASSANQRTNAPLEDRLSLRQGACPVLQSGWARDHRRIQQETVSIHQKLCAHRWCGFSDRSSHSRRRQLPRGFSKPPADRCNVDFSVAPQINGSIAVEIKAVLQILQCAVANGNLHRSRLGLQACREIYRRSEHVINVLLDADDRADNGS